jgi:hypothetical protein
MISKPLSYRPPRHLLSLGGLTIVENEYGLEAPAYVIAALEVRLRGWERGTVARLRWPNAWSSLANKNDYYGASVAIFSHASNSHDG